MSRFLAELKRRRVLRVTGVYLIAAWAAIQVADTVFPNLDVPQWAVRLVIVVSALGLPIVMALAWTFDLTREGVLRTEALADGSARTPVNDGPAGRWRLLVGTLALVLVLGLGGWWFSRSEPSELDSGLVVVLPFRVAGADESLGYLREGLMDLLAATLTGRDGVPAAVSPRTLTQVLREQLGSVDVDASERQALDIARVLGAGRVLAGELIGTGDNLTVTARLYDAATGAEMTRTSFALHPDSLHRIVDRIAARLMAADAGLGEDRLASVTTTSLPALRAYLDGAQAFRRGDHFAAMDAWDRALDLDSTFALAGLGLARASGWTIVPSRHSERAFAVAWAGRLQLGEADRALIDALSPRYPLLASFAELLDARRQAVERFPHDPDLRFLLGDAYLHYGAAAGQEDFLEQARAHLARVTEADSTHVEALIHLHDIAQELQDSAGMRRYGDLIIAMDSTSPLGTKVRHERAPDAFDLDTLDAPALTQLASDGWYGRIDTAATDAIIRAIDRVSASSDRDLLIGYSSYLAMWEGRPGRLRELFDRGGNLEGSRAQRLSFALFSVADTQSASREAAELRRSVAELQSAGGSGPNSSALIEGHCMLAHWEAAYGTPAAAERHASALTGWLAEQEGAPSRAVEQRDRSTARLCADLVRATLAVRSRAPSALARLSSVDSSLAAGVRLAPPYYEAANLHNARLWRALDRPGQALVAVRRRVALPGYVHLVIDSQGEEARILDDLGRREEAIHAYAHVLGWRERAEGVFAEQAARDRARLAALLEERD